MSHASQVYESVYQIGGPEITGRGDCCVYLVHTKPGFVLVDSGLGRTFNKLLKNIEGLNFNLENMQAIIVTHGHVDHVGSLSKFKKKFEVDVIAHDLDADRVETGRNVGSELYGVSYDTCKVDEKLSGEKGPLEFGKPEIKFLHIPGHTPGSIALYLDVEGKRVLFAQDVHGPYTLPGSDSSQAKESLEKLIDLEADILCEGHYGIFRPSEDVKKFIRSHLKRL